MIVKLIITQNFLSMFKHNYKQLSQDFMARETQWCSNKFSNESPILLADSQTVLRWLSGIRRHALIDFIKHYFSNFNKNLSKLIQIKIFFALDNTEVLYNNKQLLIDDDLEEHYHCVLRENQKNKQRLYYQYIISPYSGCDLSFYPYTSILRNVAIIEMIQNDNIIYRCINSDIIDVKRNKELLSDDKKHIDDIVIELSYYNNTKIIPMIDIVMPEMDISFVNEKKEDFIDEFNFYE